VTPWHWIALLATLAAAIGLPGWARRRWGTSAAGRRFFRHPVVAAALGILAFFALVAVAAPVLAPYQPNEVIDIVAMKNRAPSLTHPLGTDHLSRDSWSRLVHGARVSLVVGTLAMILALTVGATVGALAGYFRRRVDAILMRGVDVGLAIPRIFIVLMLVAVWDQPGLATLVLVIGLTSWFGTSRLVRAEVLSLREREYVAGARALGARAGRVITRHVLPNAAAPIIVSAALGIGNVMLLEAALSYLGVGVRPPRPSWGTMVADGQHYLVTAPWSSLFPGLAIALVVMALNALGDALRDALDPRAERA
jgi:peptide/nickel transport system permease protein